MQREKQPRKQRKNTRKNTGTKKRSRNMETGNFNKASQLKIIEPVTTLIDDGKFLRILTQMPGISEEKIKIDLENHTTSVTIVASDTEFQYKKVITIPCEVRISKKRFSDGVLELTLEKNGS
jgi:HSP20 family molecular chaperone IbpA